MIFSVRRTLHHCRRWCPPQATGKEHITQGLPSVLLESINCFNATEREGLKVGFVGLGQMGKPMAMNLLKSSTQLLVNSASAKTYPDFEANGERTTKKLKELAETDLTFLCLPSSEVVRSEQGPPNG
jgi:phosphoglycerate dehydrogenase-like enzyme